MFFSAKFGQSSAVANYSRWVARLIILQSRVISTRARAASSQVASLLRETRSRDLVDLFFVLEEVVWAPTGRKLASAVSWEVDTEFPDIIEQHGRKIWTSCRICKLYDRAFV